MNNVPVCPCLAGNENSRQKSAALFSFVVVSVALVLLGNLIFWSVPAASPDQVARGAADVLDPSRILPEPQEKATYFGLLAVLPPLLLCAGLSWRRLDRTLGPAAFHFAAIAGLSGFFALLMADTYWSRLLWPLISGSVRVWILTAILVAVSFVCVWRVDAANVLTSVGRIAVVGSVAIGALVTFCSRIFDARAITQSAAFWGHYEAAVYSVVQVSNGGTCLVDVIPQYGCYSEFMAPLIRLIGVSTFSTTLVFATLQCVCFLTLFFSASRLVKQPLLLVVFILLIIMVTNRIWIGAPDDPYFQGMPVRMLFPVLSLLVAQAWLTRHTRLRAFLIGAFAGLSLVWNLDSGAVVVVALAGFVPFGGCTAANWRWPELLRRLPYLLLYGLGVVIAVGVTLLLLRWKAGTWLSLAEYVSFQRLFFVTGFMSLPMSPFPSLWGAFVGCALVTLCLLTARIGSGPEDRELELMAYLAVMALGLFSYYVGRSHWQTLALVSWPFFLLATALADRAWRTTLKLKVWTRVAGSTLLAIALVWTGSMMTSMLSVAGDVAAKNWARYRGTLPPDAVYSDVEYVRSAVPPGSKVAIIAKSAAPLFADTGLKSAIVSMSWVETLRKSDAARQIAQILNPGVDHLLLESSPLGSWVTDSLPTIREKYALIERSPSGRMLHLVPRDRKGQRKDLFEEERAPVR